MACTRFLLDATLKKRSFVIFEKNKPYLLKLRYDNKLVDQVNVASYDKGKELIKELHGGMCFKCGNVSQCIRIKRFFINRDLD